MKRFFSKITAKNLGKPLIYKLISKILISILLCIIWMRYGNTLGFYNNWQFLSALLCGVFGTWAWFSFLALDGVGFRRPPKEKKKKTKQSTASIIDHLDTEPDAFAELSFREKTLCDFASALLLFFVFLLCALIS